MTVSTAELTEDALLVDGARRGDALSWERLVHAHQPAVFRYAYLMLHDADDAADIAQETFIRAGRALDRFDTTRPLRPWLLRIATNLARNRRRSVVRYLAALRRDLRTTPPLTIAPDDRIGARWEAQQLWQAIRRLEPQEQELLYLRFFLEQGATEIATTLDIPLGTAKSRLHRAVNHLRTVVDHDFPALREERKP
ncbi:MAG: sigma-70 family RNA polymerase sigma factor [Herpetosiphon sp.]